MNIIKQNPFRILGLTGNTTEKELQKQLSKIKAYIRVGKEVSLDYDFRFLGELERNETEIQDASNRIEQAHKRFIYSLFWFVKKNDFDEIALNYLKDNKINKAEEIWDKTLKTTVSSKNYSSYHNLSTLYIGLSTVNGQVDLKKLQKGIALKGNLLQSEYLKDLIKIVTSNESNNNTNEIIKKFIDEILELLIPYLEQINGISTKELINFFNAYPANIQKYISSKFTERPISNIENKIKETIRKRKENPVKAYSFGMELYETTRNDLTVIKRLLNSSNIQYQILSDKVASEILQCSIDYFNINQENNKANFRIAYNNVLKLINLSNKIVFSNQIKERIQENLSVLLTLKNKRIDQIIELLQSIKSAYDSKKYLMYLDIEIHNSDNTQEINHNEIEEEAKNTINWYNVIKLIVKNISSEDVEEIRYSNDEYRIEKYKSLVNFLFEKLDSISKLEIWYLVFWKTDNPIINLLLFINSSQKWVKWTATIMVIILTLLIAFFIIAVIVIESSN